jgi:hypothetical protein
MADVRPAIEVLDNLFAPEMFADDALTYSVLNGTVRIVFSASKFRSPHRDEAVRVVVGRLVLPLEGAERLSIGLYDFLKSRGRDPREVVTNGEPMQ